MPALLTHCLCGDMVFKSIEAPEATDVISHNRNLFNLGTQGPDIFFYHNALPWVKGESLSRLGGRLHSEKVGAFFQSALAIIDSIQDAVKEMLLSYVYGYICHYSLDVHAHPYVFYKTGFEIDETEDIKKYDAYHRRFEAEIDVLMADKILNTDANKIGSHELIMVGKKEALAIADMYHRIFKKIFDLDIPIEEIQKAPDDMRLITKAFRDPLGIKKPVVAFAEKLMGKHNLISNMIYPPKVDSGLDQLNIKHSLWYCPWDKEIPRNSSFMDLFNEAAAEAKLMCESINGYINGNIGIDEVLRIIGNRSFSSGLDCCEDIKFKYHDLIYR